MILNKWIIWWFSFDVTTRFLNFLLFVSKIKFTISQTISIYCSWTRQVCIVIVVVVWIHGSTCSNSIVVVVVGVDIVIIVVVVDNVWSDRNYFTLQNILLTMTNCQICCSSFMFKFNLFCIFKQEPGLFYIKIDNCHVYWDID